MSNKLPVKLSIRIWRISSTDKIKDAIDSVKYKPFDMTVKKYEGNKALMMIQKKGETRVA